MKKYIILIAIIVLGAFLRINGLKQQAVIFFDEGQVAVRALDILALIKDPPQTDQARNYIDTKLFWVLLVAAGRALVANTYLVAKSLSAACGIATILLTYLLARRFYRDETVALLSALFLAVSSYHVFYCRLALPDAAAAFLALLGFYCYSRALSGRWTLAALAGLAFSGALMVHYRSAALLVFFPAAEAIRIISGKVRLRSAAPRLMVFVSMIFLSAVAFEIWARGRLGLSFWDTVIFFQQRYSGWNFDPVALYAYLRFIMDYDGILAVLLLAVSLLFLKGRYPTLLPLSFVALQIFLCSTTLFKFPRLLSTILPLLSIVYAATCANLLYDPLLLRFRKALVVLAVLGLGATTVKAYQDTTRWKAYAPEVAAWFRQNIGEQETVLATNHAVLFGYLPVKSFVLLSDQRAEDLAEYLQHGVQYVIIDPHKYTWHAYNHGGKEMIIHWLEQTCQPIHSFPAFHPELFQRFLREHSHPTLRQSLNALEHVDEPTANRIHVYDIQQCELKNGVVSR